MSQTTTPTTLVARSTRRQVWFTLHNLILERSLPEPTDVRLRTDKAAGPIVWLEFEGINGVKRWAASLSLEMYSDCEWARGDLPGTGWIIDVSMALAPTAADVAQAALTPDAPVGAAS